MFLRDVSLEPVKVQLPEWQHVEFEDEPEILATVEVEARRINWPLILALTGAAAYVLSER